MHDESATAQRPPSAGGPLWRPAIPVLGVCGEYASGKTLFALTIGAGPRTRVYDTEKSSESYQQLNFDRVDVPLEMQRQFPKGYKPIDTFTFWVKHVREIEPGRFDVIALDVANDIETGAVDWVRANPGYFSRTAAQYIKMSGLLWGDMKNLWKSILTDIASRCQTFVFAVHMGEVWAGDKPSGKRKPRGKSTLFELASLFIQLERPKDARGVVPAVPSAIVLKCRLAHVRRDEATGAVEIVPALPPRLPVATPEAIRHYLDHPPNYSKLTSQERAPEKEITEDDRAAVRLATAEAEAEAERFRLERLERQQRAEERRSDRPAAVPSGPEAPGPQQAAQAATLKPAEANGATKQQQPEPGKATFAQLQQLESLRAEVFGLMGVSGHRDLERETWAEILGKRKVTTAGDLTPDQAAELIENLTRKAEALHAQRRPGSETEEQAAQFF
jgi:hypothetical protein